MMDDNPVTTIIGMMLGVFGGLALMIICGTTFFDWRDCAARNNLGQYETKYEGFTCFIKSDGKWYSRDEFENRRNITRLHLNEDGELSE